MNKTEEKIEDIINCAELGRYDKYINSSVSGKSFEEMLLDPKFWQAIGKQKGWEQPTTPLSGVKAINRGKWLYIAENFHTINLTQSFDDAINYLYELIK